MMKFGKIEDRLAVIAAVVVLLGVSMAAEDVFAAENAPAALEVTMGATTSVMTAGKQ